MDEPIKDATFEEKIAYINGNLKPLYKSRYETGLLIEALATMIDIYGDDSMLNESDKTSKEFHAKRKEEAEKQLARDGKLIEFFEKKLKPLLAEQSSAPAQPSADIPTVPEPAPNGAKEKIDA